MVVVDCEVRGGRLADVVVSGDFFLYPEDALPQITFAVEGLPASASEAEIAAAVRAATGAGVTFLGFSPEAVGIAVRRALSSESQQ